MTAPSTASSRGNLLLFNQLSPRHSIHMVGHTTFGVQQCDLIPLLSSHDREGTSFPGCVPPDDMVNSVLGIKLGDSGVVIGYHIDIFTHTWLVKHFVA